MKFRIAVVQSHAICYHAPLYRRLAQHPQIDLTVYYFCPDFSLVEGYDAEIGRHYKWDIPILDGYRHTFLRNRPLADTGFWSFFNPRLVWELTTGRYDAVIIQGYRIASEWIAFASAWLSRTPIIFRGDTGPRPTASRLRRLVKTTVVGSLFRTTKACLAISTPSTQFYEEFGVERSKLFLAPYSVDNDFFAARVDAARADGARIRAALGLPIDRPVITQVSKLIPRKRPLDLLKAFANLDRRAALVYAGDGELRTELEAYTRAHGIEHVYFTGFRNQGELPDVYAASDIFALPSGFDIFGAVINEAMASGLPIVTTDAVGATIDIARHRDNALVYPAGDVDALTTCLRQLLDDETLRLKMARRSREIIATWNYDACVDAMLAALRHIHGEKARSAQVTEAEAP